MRKLMMRIDSCPLSAARFWLVRRQRQRRHARVGPRGDSVSLDLAQATDGESIKAGIQVLENWSFRKDSMNVEPQLAESWKVSDDGLTWTFKLRKDQVFTTAIPSTPARLRLLRPGDFQTAPLLQLRASGNTSACR